MDLTDTIIPKSDQINADDLLAGPATVTITEVRRGSSEQPVEIVTAEFGPGRPFRPSKTVLRILVTGWGRESDVYVGRRLTIYREPTVKWAGAEVGGIRVSAMSDLTKPLRLALTASKGKKDTVTVTPLADAASTVKGITPEGVAAIVAGLDGLGIATPTDKLDAVKQAVGRDLKSARDLTADEGATVLAWIEAQAATDEPRPADA